MIKRDNIRIAFLLDDLHSEYNTNICRGILYGAQKMGVSVAFFGVGALDCPILYGKMRNRIFSLVSPEDFNGILYLSSSISNFVGINRFLKFSERYGDIPAAHIGIPAPGKKSFVIDNYAGMYALVSHMITKHDRKKIAYISGTPGAYDTEERLKAYTQALLDHGLEKNDRFVYHGDFRRDDGIQAVTEFIDTRKIEFDALIGANDLMTIYAMKELQKRGYTIPDDISVGGFDDDASAKSHAPSLTTVKQSPARLGYLSICKFVRDLKSGDLSPTTSRLPANVVVRHSCGCNAVGPSSSSRKLFPEMTMCERKELNILTNLIAKNIIGSFNEEEICSTVEEACKLFDIQNFSISTYLDDNTSKVFYDFQGRNKKTYVSRTLFHNTKTSLSSPFYIFVMPLFYRNEHIGFFLSDVSKKNLYVLEILRDHISGALKGAQLLEDARKDAARLEKTVEERTRELAKKSAQLEEALSTVRNANEKLERLAILDDLTGLYNRRGFIKIAKQNLALLKRNSG